MWWLAGKSLKFHSSCLSPRDGASSVRPLVSTSEWSSPELSMRLNSRTTCSCSSRSRANSSRRWRTSSYLKNKNSTLSLEPHRKNAHLMWLTKIIKKLNAKVANFALKGQCQEIFGTLFIKKTPTANWAPYEQTVLRYFLFSRRYSRKMCVHVVNDYADIVSA